MINRKEMAEFEQAVTQATTIRAQLGRVADRPHIVIVPPPETAADTTADSAPNSIEPPATPED